jgi:alkylation response protein AidB-like acyl-CoA dehydrogenase
MADALLADAIDRYLAEKCSGRTVRAVESDCSGQRARELWKEVEETGFADALVAEEAGGAGLGLKDAAPVVFACGRHVVPLPLAETMVVRAALVEQGIRPPTGPIAISANATPEGDGLRCAAVPCGLSAEWVLVPDARRQLLLPVAAARRTRSGGAWSLGADLAWSSIPAETVALDGAVADADWLAIAAALTAAQMAAAIERIVDLTVTYANDRVQFGRPIGRLQAIQQQISVMAEQSYAATAAAHLGLGVPGWRVVPNRAAVAKSRANDAAGVATAVAHAVHGALGITAEYDLQLFTRRLSDWRLCHGGASYWNERLGRQLLASEVPVLEFILDRVLATAAPAGALPREGR